MIGATHNSRRGQLPMWPGLAAWAIVAWLVFAPAPARAQFGMDTARVIVLEGRVSVERLGELWILQAGQTVRGGQVVVTGPDGYAQMELSDHSLVEVFANSRLVFRASPFNFRDLIDLYLGRIKLQIQHLTGGDSPYRVTTPTAVISIRGTVLNVDVGPTEETIVHVEEGSVGVRHRLMPGREISVETGETIQVLPNVPLAALPRTTPLAIAGKVVRAAGETPIRIRQATAQSGGNSGGSAPSSTAGSPPSGSDSGSNETPPLLARTNPTPLPATSSPNFAVVILSEAKNLLVLRSTMFQIRQPRNLP